MTTDELLAALDERGIRNVDIARALGLPDSRIPEIRQRKRALKLDEGAALIRAFGLEKPVQPLPTAIVRLLVRYVAQELGLHPEERKLQDLTKDVRAFAEFVADPKVRESLVAVESFFQAMRLRRPAPESKVRSGTDPDLRH